MIRYRVLLLLFLVSSMTSQLIRGMLPTEEISSIPSPIQEIGDGIAQKIEELPKELKYAIFSYALALRENPKYELYKKFDVGSRITGIALNHDNTKAFTGSEGGTAHLWDVGKERVLKVLKGHNTSILSVALSADGTLALTGSYHGTTQVWNMNTGELLNILQVGSPIYSVALNANGTTALIGSFDNIVRLYNTSTGELLKILEGHKSTITSVALSADGSNALTGSWDGTVRIWNILTGKSIILQVGLSVNSVTLSANGTIAVAATIDNKVLVWDTQSGTLLNRLLPKNKHIYSVIVSKDGKRALVATHDRKIQVWNTKPLPGQKETSTPLTVIEGHTKQVTALAFGNDDFIASGSFDNTALIWKPFALKPRGPQEHKEILWQAYKETFSRPLLRSANGIIEGIAQKIAELPKELRYAIFSYALALLENPKYELYKKFDVGSQARGIAFNADNTRALTGSVDGVARLWDVENRELLKELKGHSYEITSVALSADGTIALTGSTDKTARVWNTYTGELISILEVGSWINSVALSADGSTALSASFDGCTRLYTTSTGELLKVLEGHTSIALSTNGSSALTGSYDGIIQTWDILTGELLKTFQAGSSISSVALSADGNTAVIGTAHSKTLVLNVKKEVLLNTLVTTDFGFVNSVSLSKDGKRILTSAGNTIQVWNTKPLPGQKETSTPLTVLEGHTDRVRTAVFGGADFIASGSHDNTIIIWKSFALEPRDPQENVEVLWQAYKETFSRPLLRSTNRS